MSSKPFTWSWSSLSDFETCPRQYYLTKVTKEVVRPASPEMTEGRRQHTVLENAIKGVGSLGKDMMSFKPLVDRLRATPGKITPERKVALTADYTETTYFAKDVWMRSVYDVEVLQPDRLIVIDWKTGKRKEDYKQLQLFAAVGFSLYPRVQEVETAYAWLPDKKIDRETYTRDQKEDLWGEFIPIVQRMEIAGQRGDFPPRPSGLCRKHCPVGKHRCEHCGDGR